MIAVVVLNCNSTEYNQGNKNSRQRQIWFTRAELLHCKRLKINYQ